ncbi:MAG: SPOR domain-containing protein [Candidatus Latescibacteria bacterium]|nr:SPOR domain-containing protein [Candidatus Latescibacterota bacterium]
MTVSKYLIFQLIASIIFFAYGCGAGVKSSDSKTSSYGMIEDIDPFSFGDEYAINLSSADKSGSQKPVVPQNVTNLQFQSNAKNTDKNAQNTELPASSQEIPGYRVQIGMFNDETEAYSYAERARLKVEIKVYVIYEAPFFRVRVGDFRTQKDAENYVKILKENGFRNSWWIRTKVNVN